MLGPLCKCSKPSGCDSRAPQTPGEQVSLPHFTDGKVKALSCYSVQLRSGHADTQTQAFAPRKPRALSWPRLFPVCVTCSAHRGPPGRRVGRPLRPGRPASPEAASSLGNGGLPDARVLVPKSIMITCPAGNHGHGDTNNQERVELVPPTAPAQPALCPSVLEGKLGRHA